MIPSISFLPTCPISLHNANLLKYRDYSTGVLRLTPKIARGASSRRAYEHYTAHDDSLTGPNMRATASKARP